MWVAGDGGRWRHAYLDIPLHGNPETNNTFWQAPGIACVASLTTPCISCFQETPLWLVRLGAVLVQFLKSHQRKNLVANGMLYIVYRWLWRYLTQAHAVHRPA